MNKGVLQSSPVQQMMAGNPNWWIINNNMKPPLTTSSTLHHQQQQQFLSPNYLPSYTNHLFPYSPFICTPPPPPSSTCNSSSSSPSSFAYNWHQEHQDHQPQLHPESLSQLLMGGLVGCDEQVLNHHLQQVVSSGMNVQSIDDEDHHVKQENSSSYVYEHATNDHHQHLQDFQQLKPTPTTTTTTWPPHHQIMMPITSSPNSSSLTSFSSNTNMLEFSTTTTKGDHVTGRHPPPDRSSECNSSGSGGGAVKKARVEGSSSTRGQTAATIKVRKEKLGDRITALHQLVSPFGKTDTASVLLEAIGSIRFLRSQIEALSLPYLGCGSPNMAQQKSDTFEESKKDLKSRGLCLVPVSCTLQVGSDNGADYWAPAIGGAFQ